MIQILTYTGREESFKGKDIVLSSIHNARSLDEFDINIISLADKDMWEYSGQNYDSINTINDLKSLSIMIYNSKKTNIIILLPQNENYYYYKIGKEYNYVKELKNMTQNVCNIVSKLFDSIGNVKLNYENTVTRIGNEDLKASFYLSISQNVLLRSEKSKKPTAVKLDRVIFSTLNLATYDQIINFLRELELIQDKQDVPDWMEEIKMFDDNKQLQIIEENNLIIKAANDNISDAMERINKNNEYKSILYTFGDELVKVVFEILEEMLGCDLSQFEDKKKEDFLFEKGGYVFIGEIKGVNHNVKNENVTQLDVHYQGYLDEHEDESEDHIKAILVMNHQKNKPLEAREPVHERQIDLAKRNKSLIIETITLLKLFEKYLNEEISQEECLELLKSNTGLFTI